jgi:ABC-type lipoprotein release transport system permease subunit
MPAGNLVRMVVSNTVRSPRHFVLSVFGIVIGIASFALFLALSTGVSNVLLGKVFPIEQVEVRAPHASLLGKDISKKLDDSVVQKIKSRPEVSDAVPRMNASFPALGFGTFEGEELNFEVGGFADGIPPSVIEEVAKSDPNESNLKMAEMFKDWDELETNRPTCVPPPRWDDLDDQGNVIPPEPVTPPTPAPATTPAAGSGSASGSGSAAGSGSGTGAGTGTGAGSAVAAAPPKPKHHKPHPLTKNPCANPDLYYCDSMDHTCHHRVPVLVSQTLIELYNSQFAPAHNLPEIGELETFIAKRGGFGAMSFEIHLGDTLVAGSNAQIDPAKKHIVQAVVVGISPKAMMTGMTMPLGYMRRWVKEYVGDDAAKQYSKIIVTLKNKNRLAVFNQWVEDEGLRTEDSVGERFATAIFVVEILFFVISFAIIVISAINIAHNLFMQVSERRREIGVLRAVGATRADVRLIILGEAAVIGVVGGLLGLLSAEVLAHVADWALTRYLPRFPFKPDTYFDFKLWIMAGGMAFSTVFCVIGGFLPARKASLIEPAQALAAQ